MRLVFPSIALLTAMTVQAQHIYNSPRLQVHHIADKPVDKNTANIERATKAFNYGNRIGLTNVDLRSAAPLPAVRGEAKVERKQGHIEIQAEVNGLQDANRFGPEYLTYVLWAIAPEGRVRNLGEVLTNDTKSQFRVTIGFDVFGLIVTAEPYFAVSQPSDVVVLENFFSKDAVPEIEEVEAKYEVLPRGTYTANVSRSELKPIVVDPNTPLDLYEARNAFWIALWAGAEKDAAELFAKAERSLQKAEAFHASRAEAKQVSMVARETVQMAENARVIALKHRSENLFAAEGHRTECNNGRKGRHYVDNE